VAYRVGSPHRSRQPDKGKMSDKLHNIYLILPLIFVNVTAVAALVILKKIGISRLQSGLDDVIDVLKYSATTL